MILHRHYIGSSPEGDGYQCRRVHVDEFEIDRWVIWILNLQCGVVGPIDNFL